MRTLIRNARVIAAASGQQRGAQMQLLHALPSADVVLEGDRVLSVSPSGGQQAELSGEVVNAEGRVLMPAFVDCHTHACWAGSRLDEWQSKLRGVGYLDILRAGGGIMSTVRAVRAATQSELRDQLAARLDSFLDGGTTTVEVKSGYGLNTDAELKMLRAICDAAKTWPGTVVPTALLGHAIDPDVERTRFIDLVVNETLPAVSREFSGIAVDAYCETAAWTPQETLRLLAKARELGHPIRAHIDQFNSLGCTGALVALGARSVDHLEAASVTDLKAIGASRTIGVALPACGMHLDNRYADLRAIIDGGGACAIATNCNPGSAPTTSMPLVMQLAVRQCGLSPAEAIIAGTANAAEVLDLADRGRIVPGARADLVLLRYRDERELVYYFGENPVERVWCAGRPVRR